MFDRITDPRKIADTMREFMLRPTRQNCEFIATIYDKKNNRIHEGVRPIAAVNDSAGYRFSLANSDSEYGRSYAQVELGDIEYIELLRK